MRSRDPASFGLIQIAIVVFSFLIVIHSDDTRHYSVLYHTYSNKLRDSDNEMCLGRGTRRAKKRERKRMRERGNDGSERDEREWHLHWLPAKSHLIKMSGRLVSGRVEATRTNASECHPSRNPVPARFGLGRTRGTVSSLLLAPPPILHPSPNCLDVFPCCVATRRATRETNAEVIAHGVP